VAIPDLGAIISRVQARFIRAAPTREVLEPLLNDLLACTGSRFGYIASVLDDPADGHRFLRMVAVSDEGWDAGTPDRMRAGRRGEPPVELHQLSTLFGSPALSGAPVIANDVHDPRLQRLAPGPQPLASYLGVPLWHGGELVGVVGLVNREGGYQQALVDALEPLFVSLGGIMGAVRLDEARRAAERALRESEELLRTTFEMAAVGIAHITLRGRVARANQQLCEVLGYTRDELLGRSVRDVTPPTDRKANREYARRLLRGEPAGRAQETQCLRRDGHLIWASYKAALVRDGQGRPAYFITVVEDITERKRTEAALLAAQAAERANAAKTEFLSRMSHELRTPLNAVLGFAQLLQMDTAHPVTPDQRTKLHHIEEAGAHLLAMINDVLDLSRIESGGMTLAPETVSLSALVQEALALVGPSAREAGVRLFTEPPADAVQGDRVRADHLRLRQVLLNLLTNAVKYNRSGGHVAVRWGAMPSGDHVRLEVEDTGRGLTATQRTHLFEPFNRLGAERSGIEGTGIGLVVTQRLVQLMGGHIEVDSQPDVGSRFMVALPAAVPAGDSGPAQPGQPDAEHPGDAAQGARHTVLYAEDDPMNVELVRQVMLLRPDCRLSIARCGRDAIDAVRRERPDLLLLDMHLGDMTGLDVVRELGGAAGLSGLPFVALSADAMPSTIDEARRAGFLGYLTKPLDVAAFLHTLDEALAGHIESRG
jgi:PAS domain S-box-containing protein